MGPFNRIPRIRIEQDAEPVLHKVKKHMLGLRFDEQILATDPRYILYCRDKKGILIKDDISYRHYHNTFRAISHFECILPIQLKDTQLNCLHGQAGKPPGISKMMQDIRQKNYFPSIAKDLRKQVKQCQTCVQDKRIDS